MDTRRNQNGMKEQGALHRQTMGAFSVYGTMERKHVKTEAQLGIC